MSSFFNVFLLSLTGTAIKEYFIVIGTNPSFYFPKAICLESISRGISFLKGETQKHLNELGG